MATMSTMKKQPSDAESARSAAWRDDGLERIQQRDKDTCNSRAKPEYLQGLIPPTSSQQSRLSPCTSTPSLRNLNLMTAIARLLVKLGLMLILAGGLVYLLGRLGISLGSMPGDLTWRRRNFTVFFPLGTSILLSILLTLLFYLFSRFRR